MERSLDEGSELEALLWALSSSPWLSTLYCATGSSESRWPCTLPSVSGATTLDRARAFAQILLKQNLESASAKALLDILTTLTKSLYLINRRRQEGAFGKRGRSTEGALFGLNRHILEEHQSAKRLFKALGLPTPLLLPKLSAERPCSVDNSMMELLRTCLLHEATRRIRLLKQMYPSLLTASYIISMEASEKEALAEHAKDLEIAFDDLLSEFEARRTLLRERFELTLEVFRSAKKTRLFQIWCELHMERLHSGVQPYFVIYDVLAAHDNSTHPNSDALHSVLPTSSIKQFRIGEMPDRGGRVTGAAHQEFSTHAQCLAGQETEEGSLKATNGLKRERRRVRSSNKRGRA